MHSLPTAAGFVHRIFIGLHFRYSISTVIVAQSAFSVMHFPFGSAVQNCVPVTFLSFHFVFAINHVAHNKQCLIVSWNLLRACISHFRAFLHIILRCSACDVHHFLTFWWYLTVITPMIDLRSSYGLVEVSHIGHFLLHLHSFLTITHLYPHYDTSHIDIWYSDSIYFHLVTKHLIL